MTVLTDDDFVRLFQERAGLTPDGWAGNDTIAALNRVFPPKVGAPPPSAQGLPADYWPMLSRIESANRPYVKAEASSASGLYQFIKSTWEGEGGRWGADMSKAFGGLQPSVEEQLQRAKTFTAKNAAYLKGKGIPINKATLYAAHFFGPVTAARVIGAATTERADLLAGAAATKANPSILSGRTVGQFLSWLFGKTGEWAK